MLIPIFLGFFLLRDILLLRIGPSAKLSPRFRIYAIVQLISVALASAAAVSYGDRVLQYLKAARFAFLIAIFYAVLAALCFWFRRTDRHSRAWQICLVPNPLLILGVSIIAHFAGPSRSPCAELATPLVIACLWVGLVGFSLRAIREQSDVSELDYSLGVAGFVNSIALLALPVESFLADTREWAEFLQFFQVLIRFD
jgi:FtsH-binding integral membrane protein